jgi:endo-1,4-beta-D-glucanase Y
MANGSANAVKNVVERLRPRNGRAPEEKTQSSKPAEKSREADLTRPSRGGHRGYAGRIWDRLALFAVLVVSGVFTGYNIFRFPNYELDEGTYMSSAWALFERGQLSNYTYTYDHPPLGWLQLGLWSKLVGGFITFGSSINTGRALMLLVAVASALLVFLIVRHVSGSVAASLLAATVFSVSPLGVGLHRQVWLDNFMTLWLLVSIYALVVARGRMVPLTVSAVTFGLAFWSKEIAVVFLPGMLYLAYVAAYPGQRRFAFSLWTATAVAAISVFTLLAFLRNEFLPSEERVSLIETFSFQASREGGGPVFSPDSDFRTFFSEWVSADTLFMVAGLTAAAAGLLFFKRDRIFFGVSLLSLFFMLLLVRGGVVLHFYVIPLLALMALAVGLLAGHAISFSRLLADRAGGTSSGRPAALGVLGLAVVLGVGAITANQANFTGDSTSAQNAAAHWIADNLPNESVLLMDAYPWADLRSEELVGDEPFTNAHFPLTALQDPEIREDTLQEPGDIDYFLHSPSSEDELSWINGDLADRELPLIDEARENLDTIQSFESESWSMELLRNRNLHKIPANENPLLANTWESYKDEFMEDGRVIDPGADGTTTSEGQAYAMLRAVYMKDREAFDRSWGWTQENLQVREDALLIWQYGEQEGGGQGVLDESTATDADTDAALALLFAAERFDNPAYEQDALQMLDDIWQEETIEVGSDLTGYRQAVVAGDWARGDGTEGFSQPIANPSYYSPYAYKIFAEADPSHPWDELSDSSYEILADISESPELGGDAGLVPDWIALDPQTGEPLPTEVSERSPDQLSGRFSFDASRVPWRIGLDYLWHKDSRALDTLENLDLPRREMENEGRLLAAYEPDGTPATDYEATSTYAGVLPGLLVGGDPALAHEVFADEIIGEYREGNEETGAHWGDEPDNYYDQNMAWFATAVMDGSMGNLYAGEETVDWRETEIDASLAEPAEVQPQEDTATSPNP